jgi:hypothetical protein
MTTPPRTPPASAYNTAIVLGIAAAAADLVFARPEIASALIVIFAFLLGLAYPRHAWQWALLIGICVPFATLIARAAGYANPTRPDNFFVSYLALVPGFIGAYSAAALRKFAVRKEMNDHQE